MCHSGIERFYDNRRKLIPSITKHISTSGMTKFCIHIKRCLSGCAGVTLKYNLGQLPRFFERLRENHRKC